MWLTLTNLPICWLKPRWETSWAPGRYMNFSATETPYLRPCKCHWTRPLICGASKWWSWWVCLSSLYIINCSNMNCSWWLYFHVRVKNISVRIWDCLFSCRRQWRQKLRRPEARAKVIAAEGEQKASQALREASEIISDSPATLQLRYLHVWFYLLYRLYFIP